MKNPSNGKQCPGSQLLHGNAARIDPKKEVPSVYVTQAMSNEVADIKNVPMTGDLDVVRERNWNIENKK